MSKGTWTLEPNLALIWALAGLLGVVVLLGAAAVQGENQPPQATLNTISPNPAYTTQAVSFVGFGSDPEGNITSYQWISDLDGFLSDRGSFTWRGLSSGNHTISFRVQDENGSWSENVTASLEVRINKPPLIDNFSISQNYLYRGDSFALGFNASDDLVAEGELTPQVQYQPFTFLNYWRRYLTGQEVVALDISAGGEYLAAGTAQGWLYFIDPQGFEPLWRYKLESIPMKLTLANNGEYLGVLTVDYQISIFRYNQSEPLWNFTHAIYPILDIALSADGNKLAAGLANHRVYTFSSQNGMITEAYFAGDVVNSVAISANGSFVAAGCRDERVYLFNQENNTALQSYQVGPEPQVLLGVEGRYLAAWSSEVGVKLYERGLPEPLWLIEDQNVTAIDLSKVGGLVALGLGSDSPELRLLGPGSSHPLWSRALNDQPVAVKLAKAGDTVAVATVNGSLLLLEGLTETPSWTIGDLGSVVHLAVSDDGSALAAAINNATYLYQIWGGSQYFNLTYAGGSWQANFTPPLNTAVGNLSLRLRFQDPQGGVSTWVYLNNSLRVLNNQPVAYIDSISPSLVAVNQPVTFNGHGEDADGTIAAYRWESSLDGLLSGLPYFTTPTLSEGEHLISFRVQDSDGEWSLASQFHIEIVINQPPTAIQINVLEGTTFRGNNITVKTLVNDDLSDLDELTPYMELESPNKLILSWTYMLEGPAYHLDNSEIGDYFGVGTYSEDNRLYLFSTTNQELIWSFSPTDLGLSVSGSMSVAISSNGEYIVTGNLDHSSSPNKGMYLFHRDSNEPIWNFDTGYASINSIDISSDGRYIIATTGANLYLFNRNSSQPIWSFQPERGSLKAIISDDGEYILANTAASGHKLYLFSTNSNTPLWSYYIGENIETMAFSGNGEYLVAGSSWPDGALYLFNSDSGIPIWSYRSGNRFLSVAISDDGKYIVAAEGKYLPSHNEHNIYFFERNSSTPQWIYPTDSSIWSVSLSNNGSMFAAVSGDGLIYLFEKESDIPVFTYNTTSRLAKVILFDDGKRLIAIDYEGKVYLFAQWGRGYLSPPSFTNNTWQATFAPPLDAPLGDYSFRVRFTDPQGLSSSWYYANASLQVVNRPPRAHVPEPGEPIVVNEGQAVRLEGWGSDEEGQVVSYRWLEGDETVAAQGPDARQLNLSWGLAPGNHTYYFAVQDNDGDWSELEPVYLEVNARPTAQIIEMPTATVLYGSLITLRGTGNDSDSPGGVVTTRWSIGPLVYDLVAGQALELDTGELTPGPVNYTFRVQDTEGAWSLGQEGWLYLNVPPMAYIEEVTTKAEVGHMVVVLWGGGRDYEGRVVAYQWHSDRDGLLGTYSQYYARFDSLTVGTHRFSLRVKDDQGFWSEWVAYPYPVVVTEGLDPDKIYIAGRAIPKNQFYLTLAILTAAPLVAGGRRWQVKTRLKPVQSSLWRLERLQRQAEAARLAYPRQRLREVVTGLRKGRISDHQMELELLVGQMEALVESHGLARYQIDQVRGLVHRAPVERANELRPTLHRAEVLYAQGEVEKARWLLEGLQRELEADKGLKGLKGAVR